jgi:hypothetical protein
VRIRTLVPPQFRSAVPPLGLKETTMKKLLVGALIAGSFFPFEARAQERAGDAALGAVSGAVVLGPVGAVAGALIGYTAGPSIARSWGVRRSASSSRARRATRASTGTLEQVAARASSPSTVGSAGTPSASKSGPPPVQGLE